MAAPEAQSLDPTLLNILDNKKLKWIFVGGKGGVGKTTTSCCLSIQLAAVRDSVLIISTDPAHNLSDAFGQKFGKTPTLVTGFKNLFAMEIDPTLESENFDFLQSSGAGFLKDIAQSLPGIDEAMSFAEVLQLVNSMDFSVVVFDTAPTGHTLRLLSFPTLLEKTFGNMGALKNKFGGLINQFSQMFGMEGDAAELSQSKFEATSKNVQEVNRQFKNPDLTTFVCVCIPEFLSLYETERLIQELVAHEIDTQNVVVNQIVFPDDDHPCRLCSTRSKMQQKYIDQIHDLYEDFHIVKLPLLDKEVRGIQALSEFSKYLFKPYVPPYPSSQK